MDQSGNGQLSLAEIELGVLSYVGQECYIMKPAIKMAYKTSRHLDKNEDAYESSFVDLDEFNALLHNLQRYFQLYAKFEVVDVNHDNKISFEEFEESCEFLYEEFNIVVMDEEEEFAAMDTNGGGAVLFEEFCDWALRKGF